MLPVAQMRVTGPGRERDSFKDTGWKLHEGWGSPRQQLGATTFLLLISARLSGVQGQPPCCPPATQSRAAPVGGLAMLALGPAPPG